ncbi:MAG: hypothetical protein ABSD29_20555 [Verrucomicrobiota bacterium]
MNSAEAKAVLLLYRPGAADAADPPMTEALELARQDPELGRWFEEHRAFQKAMRAKFRQIEVPAHLKTSLLTLQPAAQTFIPPPAWWRRPVWLTAAVAALLLLGLAGVWLQPRAPDRFANYQSRMVSEAQREYRMDLLTNDMRQIRQFMASRGAPADYDLTPGLEHLRLTGGGRLTWRSHPVTMVCFDRGDQQMLFLFVMKRSAVKDPPPETPQLAKVRQRLTASWTHGDNTYVLAGPEEADFVKKYL